MKIILLLVTIVSLGVSQTASELNKKAESLYSQGKKSEAHELFLKAYDLDNSSTKVMGNLSVSFLGRGEYDRSIYWGKELLKNTTNSTLMANGNYNIAKAHEALKQHKKARLHFRRAYQANPRSVYLRSIDKINAEVDREFMKRFRPEHKLDSAESEELKLSEKGYGEPTKLHEILGIDKSKPIPAFIDQELLSENGYAKKINITNNYVKDIYFNSIMGSGRFTNYYVITKDGAGEWKLLKETVGGNCCYEEPDFLTLKGLNYFVGPDEVIRYDNEEIKFRYSYKPDTTERVLHVKDIMNGSLFNQLETRPGRMDLTRSHGIDTSRVDIGQDGSMDIIVRRGESSGGMGQWFRYEVTVNGNSLWSEEQAEGLRSSSLRIHSGNCYFINIYDDLSCKVFLYENGKSSVKSIVELEEELVIEYIWSNLLK